MTRSHKEPKRISSLFCPFCLEKAPYIFILLTTESGVMVEKWCILLQEKRTVILLDISRWIGKIKEAGLLWIIYDALPFLQWNHFSFWRPIFIVKPGTKPEFLTTENTVFWNSNHTQTDKLLPLVSASCRNGLSKTQQIIWSNITFYKPKGCQNLEATYLIQRYHPSVSSRLQSF